MNHDDDYDTHPRPGPDSRQIVILCDGTNANLTGRREDTHIVTLAELLAAHPDPRRIVMYDPGVGNPDSLPSARFTDDWRRRWQRLQGLVQGRGVFENIVEGYEFLVRHWRPGDEIFVFGYSRGAFTARSIAGLINRFGIVRPDAAPVMTTLLNVYFSGEGAGGPASSQALRLFTPEGARKVRVQFVGVWDTVEAVGLPPFRTRFSVAPTLAGKHFMHVRQALSLDESRRMFRPRTYAQADGHFETAFGDRGSLEQLWFRGAHADVGAQVPAGEAGLGAEAFNWLVSEAVNCGFALEVDGVSPRDEAAVARAVMALPGHSRASGAGGGDAGDVTTWGARAVLHDAVRMGALWALTGLEPRDTRLDRGSRAKGRTLGDAKRDADLKAADPDPTTMKEHDSVALRHALVPTHWQTSGVFDHVMRAIPLLVACALGLFAFVGAGRALMTGRGDAAVSQVFSQFGHALAADAALQRWQLLGPWNAGRCVFESELPKVSIDLCAAPLALGWDFLLIACYAYVGARIVSWAYGRCIGQRRAADPPTRLWSALGLALPLAVVADVAENSMTLLTVSMLRSGMDTLPLATGAVMAAASLLKWAGLAGVALLWIVAMLRRPAVPRARAVALRAMALGGAAPLAAVGFVGDAKSVEIAAGRDTPHDGQRVIRGDDGFERPAWANKKDDD